MVFITAARSDVDAAVAYHGGATEKYLGAVGGLKAPLLMHLGEKTNSFPRQRKLRSRRPWRKRRMRSFTAIRVSVTPFRGTTARTTMRQRLPSPISGHANFQNQHLR
jgi:dienelactone hydrolase